MARRWSKVARSSRVSGSGFNKHPVGNPDLADVVQQGGHFQLVAVLAPAS